MVLTDKAKQAAGGIGRTVATQLIGAAVVAVFMWSSGLFEERINALRDIDELKARSVVQAEAVAKISELTRETAQSLNSCWQSVNELKTAIKEAKAEQREVDTRQWEAIRNRVQGG